MPEKTFLLREQFHLIFLRGLASRLVGRPYAVKGGICLRFFHRSPRLSEDMDFDVSNRLPVKTLQNHVDAVMTGGALQANLRVHGVEGITASKPKQTATTQRWKITLALTGGGSTFTRLEFSRRQSSVESKQGIPDAEILRSVGQQPFAACFYDARAMACQKILALASPTRNAARDLFDLNHLFVNAQVDPLTLKGMVDPVRVEQAAEKAGHFELDDFREQVVPFLPGDLADYYQTSAAFSELRQGVETKLLELLS